MSRRRWMKWIAEEAARPEFVMPWERAAKAERRRADPKQLERLLEAS